jgi:hypothetical protein
VLLLPDWMVRYLPSDAAPSEGVFHNDPSDPHSASSHTDVDCALAAAAPNIRTTTAGTIVRWKTETDVFLAGANFDRTAFIWPLRITYARGFNIFSIFDSFRSGLHRSSLKVGLFRMSCQ